MKKLLKILTAMMALLLVLTGCGGNGGSDETAGGEKVATYALVSGWNTLQQGHYAETGYYGPLVWQHIYDSLVIATDTGYLPRGAKEWSIDETGKVITMKLDETATFTDGEPVTAQDWVFSAKRLSDFDFGAPDFTKLNVLIEGTDETGLLPEGLNTDPAAFGVKALDDYTLEVTFKEPTSIDTFLSSYAFLYYVIPEHCFEGMSAAEIASSDFWNDPVGSGPWKVESHIVNSTLTLVPNETFHLGAPKLDKLIVVQMDASNFASALMSGSVDYVYPAVDPKSGAALLSAENVDVQVSDFPYSTRFLMINNTRLNKEVRLAIDMAINKDLIVEQLFGDGAVAVESMELYGSEWYNNDLVNRYDPEAAKAMLEQSDWTSDRVLKVLTPSGDRANIATIIEQDLEAIGMQVEVQTVGAGTMYGEAQAGNCDFIMGQGSATLDPIYFSYNHSYSNPANTCVKNPDPALDDMVNAISAASGDEKIKLVMDYQQYLYDNAVFVPLAAVYDYTAKSSRLIGIDPLLSAHVGDNTWEWDIQ